jgi:hypothetical protein
MELTHKQQGGRLTVMIDYEGSHHDRIIPSLDADPRLATGRLCSIRRILSPLLKTFHGNHSHPKHLSGVIDQTLAPSPRNVPSRQDEGLLALLHTKLSPLRSERPPMKEWL